MFVDTDRIYGSCVTVAIRTHTLRLIFSVFYNTNILSSVSQPAALLSRQFRSCLASTGRVTQPTGATLARLAGTNLGLSGNIHTYIHFNFIRKLQWIRGSEFLWQTEDHWPRQGSYENEIQESCPEVKKVTANTTVIEENGSMQISKILQLAKVKDCSCTLY